MDLQSFNRRSFLATIGAAGVASLTPRAAFAYSASSSLRAIGEKLKAVFANPALTRNVGGAVIGVSIGGEELVLAHGSANLNTNQPFTEDTGFLLGSVTKVLVTTVLLRLVERGLVDLDAPAQRYIPEFTLSDKDAAARITVRMLINHTNGIDAHSLCPWKVRGLYASRSYTAYLPKLGVLFDPGTCVSYSNTGFVLAARVIEEITGLSFEQAMQAELFGPAGMPGATALQTQAFLRRTAVGAEVDSETGKLRAVKVFTLGEGMAGGGTTMIVSAQDMLAFGRMHLRGGMASNGTRILADTLVKDMRTTTFDLGIPQAEPIGLGWWKSMVAGTAVHHHSGGSPGGGSNFCIIPEYDATIISFASGHGGGLQYVLRNQVIEALTGRSAASPPIKVQPQPIAREIAGKYRIFQFPSTVEIKGEELILTRTFEPYDQEHRDYFSQQWSSSVFPPVSYRSVGPGQFAMVGTEPMGYDLLAVLPATAHRRMGLHKDLLFLPKIG